MIRALVTAAAYLALLAFAPDQPTGALRFVTILKWVLPALFLREVNAALNRWAENRWLWADGKSAWQWNNEIAVVTGGSKGIGAAVAKRLVSYGIRVAVLDVEPLSSEFQPGLLSKCSRKVPGLMHALQMKKNWSPSISAISLPGRLSNRRPRPYALTMAPPRS